MKNILFQSYFISIYLYNINLDPFEQYTDSDIWLALEEVELKNRILILDEATANVGPQ